jgi:tetratricopeptide (TPR) repeat protein
MTRDMEAGMRIGAGLGALTVALALAFVAPSGAWAQDAAAPAPAEAAAPAPGDEEQARAHFRLGRAHYDNGNFAQAAVEFEEAYRISQRSALLYNIYLAYRDANDTRNAATALRKYLELEKEVENRGQLEARLAALERSLADGTAPQPAVVAAAPTEPTPAPEPAATEPAPAAAASDAPAAEQDTNLVPFILMGSGGAMIIGGVVVGIMSSGKESELEDLCPDGDCGTPTPEKKQQVSDLQSSGESLSLVADILLFGGIAVAGTGAVLFVLDQMGGDASEADSGTSASLACGPGLCGATFRTAF